MGVVVNLTVPGVALNLTVRFGKLTLMWFCPGPSGSLQTVPGQCLGNSRDSGGFGSHQPISEESVNECHSVPVHVSAENGSQTISFINVNAA